MIELAIQIGILLVVMWVLGKTVSKHILIIVTSYLIALNLIPIITFADKTIPFEIENICNKTYFKKDVSDKTTTIINKDGKAEYDFDSETTIFEKYVDQEFFNNQKGFNKTHWAKAEFSRCLNFVRENAPLTSYSKKGKLPRSCNEYSKCGGSFNYSDDYSENSLLLTRGDGSIEYASMPDLNTNNINSEGAVWTSPFFIASILVFYFIILFCINRVIAWWKSVDETI